MFSWLLCRPSQVFSDFLSFRPPECSWTFCLPACLPAYLLANLDPFDVLMVCAGYLQRRCVKAGRELLGVFVVKIHAAWATLDIVRVVVGRSVGRSLVRSFVRSRVERARSSFISEPVLSCFVLPYPYF